MATERGFVEHLQSQSGLGSDLAYKKMFGEYALYFEGKVVAFACDNQLYLKPTEEGRAVLGRVVERPPYPGAKLYFLIDEELENRDLLSRLFRVTAQALPLPKPKARPKERPKAKSASAPKRATLEAAPKSRRVSKARAG